MADDCKNCDQSCFGSKTSSGCVQWDGPDIECIGVTTGMLVTDVVYNLAEKLCEHLNETVDLGCLYSGTCDSCDKNAKIPAAVQALINKICALDAGDISFSGNTFCIGNNSASIHATQLENRSFGYGNTVTGNTGSVFYDLDQGLLDLPAGFTLGSTSVTVTGSPKNGNTILAQTTSRCAQFPVELDRYPVGLNIESKVNTPSGEAVMTRNVTIPSAGTFNNTGTFDVRDFSAPNKRTFSQGDWNEKVAAQVCQNKQKIDTFEDQELVGCDDVKYPTKKLKDNVGVHSGAICDLYDRVKELEKTTITTCTADGCAGATMEMDLEAAIQQMNQTICDLVNQVAALQQQTQQQAESIASTQSNCSSCASGNCSGGNCGQTTTSPGGTTTGGTTTGGSGCSGGFCPQ